MLSYALGRALEISDKPAVDKILSDALATRGRALEKLKRRRALLSVTRVRALATPCVRPGRYVYHGRYMFTKSR